jgi:MscS family membrane protein
MMHMLSLSARLPFRSDPFRASFLSAILVMLLVSLGTREASAQDYGILMSPEAQQKEPSQEGQETSESSEQDEPAVPRATPRETMRSFLEATDARNYAKAAECLDFSLVEPEPDQSKREDLAYRLRFVLDRLAEIDPQNLSDRPDGPAFRLSTEDAELPAIRITHSRDDLWRFDAETVRQIDRLYQGLQKKAPVVRDGPLDALFPTSFYEPWFLLTKRQWILLVVVAVSGVVLDFVFRMLLNLATLAYLRFLDVKVDQKIEAKVWRPMGLLVRALVWYAGTMLIEFPPHVLLVLQVAVKVFAVIASVWTALLIIDLFISYLTKQVRRTRTKLDDLLVPLLSRMLKILVICIGVITFADMLQLPLAGLISGMGIGGLAIAFASKDAIANLFGSITVLMDQPFEIGDWIIVEGVEGSVESVGMRSTRVRTFYNSVITVPNNMLTNAVIDNMGRRKYRRFTSSLSMEYGTDVRKIITFVEGVRELIRLHPMTRKDYFHVYLNQFSASSLDVMLYCFFECPDWSAELRERERLMVDIIRLAEKVGVAFAFPTQTIHMAGGDEETARREPMPKDFHPGSTGRKAALEMVEKPMIELDPGD